MSSNQPELLFQDDLRSFPRRVDYCGKSEKNTSYNTSDPTPTGQILLGHSGYLLSQLINLFVSSESRLTVCVTRWWAGRDNAILTESTPSHRNCQKTRR